MAQLEHIEAIERRLWGAADQLRANSNYASNEVPPRRRELIRYHGVLAPNASARKQIVPAPLVEATSIEPTAEVSAQARAPRGT